MRCLFLCQRSELAHSPYQYTSNTVSSIHLRSLARRGQRSRPSNAKIADVAEAHRSGICAACATKVASESMAQNQKWIETREMETIRASGIHLISSTNTLEFKLCWTCRHIMKYVVIVKPMLSPVLSVFSSGCPNFCADTVLGLKQLSALYSQGIQGPSHRLPALHSQVSTAKIKSVHSKPLDNQTNKRINLSILGHSKRNRINRCNIVQQETNVKNK